MKRIILFLILLTAGYSKYYPNIITDDIFTNKLTYNQVYKICKSYSNNLFSSNDIRIIVKYADQFEISAINILVRMQAENSLVINANTNNYNIRKFRACSYGLARSSEVNTNWVLGTNISGQIKYYRYGGFERQVRYCAYGYRKFYNQYKKDSKIHVDMIGDEGDHKDVIIGKLFFNNGSTYAMFKYCPHLGNFQNWGKSCSGNEILIRLYKYFLKKL